MACTSFNKTIIIGRLCNDPVYTEPDGQKVKVEMAKMKIQNTNIDKEGNEIADYHDIVSFGNQAKLSQKYLHKGDLCCIEGRLDRQVYEKEGKVKAIIVAERITFMSSRKKTEEVKQENANEQCN
jgi:single-strand DNA-binding protein